MDRREFSAGAACVLGAAALGFVQGASAQVRKPEDGVEYLVLKKPAPVEAPAGRIEVVDFFWYNCPHCNAFAPLMNSWARRTPPDVTVRHVPIAFRDDFVPQQRLYFTLETLGKADELHLKVFEAIHKDRQDLSREPGILDWAGRQGLDKDQFREVFNSFPVATKTRRAIQLQDMYKVEGVPALGVAGRYYTDGQLASNMPRALQVVDYLIGEARTSR
jgi:thiol:disulfide interchange protein DsbA